MSRRTERSAARVERFSSFPFDYKAQTILPANKDICLSEETLEDKICHCRYSGDHNPPVSEVPQPRAQLLKQLRLVLKDKVQQRQQLLEDNAVFREIQSLLLSAAGTGRGSKANIDPVSSNRSLLLSQADDCLLTGKSDILRASSAPELKSRMPSAAPSHMEGPACSDVDRDVEALDAGLLECVTLSEKPAAEFHMCQSWHGVSDEGACCLGRLLSSPSLSRPCSGFYVQLILSVPYPSLKALEIQVLEALHDVHCCPRYNQVSAQNMPGGVWPAAMADYEAVAEGQAVVLIFSDTSDTGPLSCTGEQLANLLLSRQGDEKLRQQLPW
eukprot:CAMPEP_0172207426 /NCGR_PEP_ID=MMETSP1050-20130122/33828_1 /TAXON_ID=233186 /ORGANISM="Cryptomonas curvata, Strain CCAP979/52" /LENGTH=327 /DNA_ID=CAMNT_0012886741 /DNA_START=103 /DNA_END=1083 /DNA_ORIENTATION=+